MHAYWLRDEPGPIASAEQAAQPGDQRTAPRIWASPAFLCIGLFVDLMLGVTSAIPAHMVSLLREQGMDERWVLGVPAAIGLLQVFGRVLMYAFEHRFDVHQANRWIPGLVPLGLAFLLLTCFMAGPIAPSGRGQSWVLASALLFAAFYGMGNGMLTIVKGTAIALYVDRLQVGTLNGLLAAPSALARALAPLALGALWTRESGYRTGIAVLLLASLLAIVALVAAQNMSRQHHRRG